MNLQSSGLLFFLALTCSTNFSHGLLRNWEQRNGYRQKSQPHIILLMADDLGWNDVSFHGSDQIPTPNIDAIAFNGVILNNHYSQALCTPSRSALLTGRYPIHTGMQHNVILNSEPWGLPLRETLLSEELKALGYSTHMIGKWHLGFYRKEYTPIYRGFDSHYGFWTGFHDYYSHMAEDTNLVGYLVQSLWPNLKFQPFEGLDMRRGMDADFSSVGKYSTDLFTEEAVKVIRNHGSTYQGEYDQPLFLYVAYSAPHAGNYENPLQAPRSEIDKFSFIKNEERRKYAAMVSKLDDSIGRIMDALSDSGMLDNSLVVFLSDNGAQTNGIHYNRGSNFPFKGEKISPWEGGVRTIAVAWSPWMRNPGRVSNELMHISDWMPTFIAAAGGDSSPGNRIGKLPLDGVDMGAEIFYGSPQKSYTPPKHSYDMRNEVLINIDDQSHYAAIRIGDYKLIDGTTLLGLQDHWVGETGRGNNPPYNASTVTSSRTARAIKQRTSRSISDGEMEAIRSAASINCNALWPPEGVKLPPVFPPCLPLIKPCLFDVVHDPCEKRNLYRSLPNIAKKLKKRLVKLRETAESPNNRRSDFRADPKFWNGTWINWNDYPKPPIKLNGFKLPFLG